MTNSTEAGGSGLNRRRFLGKLGLAGLGATLATGLAEIAGTTSAQAKQARQPVVKTANATATPDACGSGYYPWTCYKATGKCPGGPCHPSGHCCYLCHNGWCSQYYCINSCASQVEICLQSVCV